MIEHFKPAGHKAPDVKVATALEESFPPIQRVLRYKKTIGYLFHKTEYQEGCIEDIVLARGVIKIPNKLDTTITTYPEWNSYFEDKTYNPLSYRVPSAPILMELLYRTAHEQSTLSDEVHENFSSAFKEYPELNTTIRSYHDLARITHTHFEKKCKRIEMALPEQENQHLEDMGVKATKFLRALVGQRYAAAHAILATYNTPVILSTQRDSGEHNTSPLVIFNNNKLNLATGLTSDYVIRVIRAKQILTQPGVEVRDD